MASEANSHGQAATAVAPAARAEADFDVLWRPDESEAAIRGPERILLDHGRITRDQLDKARKFLEGSERKLANVAFLEKAPKEVVKKEYQQNARLREDIQRLEANLAEFE